MKTQCKAEVDNLMTAGSSYWVLVKATPNHTKCQFQHHVDSCKIASVSITACAILSYSIVCYVSVKDLTDRFRISIGNSMEFMIWSVFLISTILPHIGLARPWTGSQSFKQDHSPLLTRNDPGSVPIDLWSCPQPT